MLLPITQINLGSKLTYTRNVQTSKMPSFTSDKRVSDPFYYNLGHIKLADGTIHQFTPDKSQMECAENLLENKSVVYMAPTGTGKTADAHFAVNKNLEAGKRTLIPVPMIALANDKYSEFKKIYGSDNVGILTGDRKINPNAPIVIMTTEILYNQMQELGKISDDIGTIVFDEAHYIANENRGNVWENTILAASKNDVQTLNLSATIGNGDKFAGWISSLNPSLSAVKVELKPSERYVPLVWELYQRENDEDCKFTPLVKSTIDFGGEIEDLSDKQKRALTLIYNKRNYKDEFYKPTDEQLAEVKNEFASYYQGMDSKEFEKILKDPYLNDFSEQEAIVITNLLSDFKSRQVKHVYEPHVNFANYTKLVSDLDREDMLPALIFKLSRNDY